MMFNGCVQHSSLRSCVYNRTLYNTMRVRLQVGLYVVYIVDWLSVFSSDQLLVLRLEDHAVNTTHSMHRIFSFLQLGALSEEKEREMISRPSSNSRRQSDRNIGPMRPVTQQLLHDFYSPFNQKLSEVLQDQSFLWNHRSS
ncbi:Carbohydrate sulfotransferase 15 [Triplophysa tibetana]|uniref:Sulfotransferase n=1 Tax=Triplophysa tibetana TaxID=1572043 RepID=A0A5A9PT47_9TELE|nr:Carbohydrate sulfotransferase 15 [Triplophysa tibetana]